MSSSCAELIKSSIRSEARFSFHGCRVWIQSRCSDVLTIWCSVPFVHAVLVAGNAWNATEVQELISSSLPLISFPHTQGSKATLEIACAANSFLLTFFMP